jgi:hypothetical protein
MEERIISLKKTFTNIIDIRNQVIKIGQILENRINKLKSIYVDFTKENKSNIFVFGLDSFRFQSKLLDIEFNDMMRLYLAIDNRMYCEYYKFHKIVVDYVRENVPDKRTLGLVNLTSNYPAYKDLEPFKVYDFEQTKEIHENIISIIHALLSHIGVKEYDLHNYQSKQEIGLNIDNFVNTFSFDIETMKQKCMLFITYMEFFHKLHSKYWQRFADKVMLMAAQINHDIKFDDNTKLSETKKKDLLDHINVENIDNKVLTNIKNSINDVSSSDSENEINEIVPENQILNLTNIEEPQEPIPTPEKRNVKDIFKRGVKKMMIGMNLLKKKELEPEANVQPVPSPIPMGEAKKSFSFNNINLSINDNNSLGSSSNDSNTKSLLEEQINKMTEPKEPELDMDDIFNSLKKKCEQINQIKPESVQDDISVITEEHTITEEKLPANDIVEKIIEKPIVEEPVVEEPVVEEPIVEEPIVEEPIVEEPVVEEPIAEETNIEEEKSVTNVEEQIVEETPIKPKRQYKPRKKKT